MARIVYGCQMGWFDWSVFHLGDTDGEEETYVGQVLRTVRGELRCVISLFPDIVPVKTISFKSADPMQNFCPVQRSQKFAMGLSLHTEIQETVAKWLNTSKK